VKKIEDHPEAELADLSDEFDQFDQPIHLSDMQLGSSTNEPRFGFSNAKK
jgi:hypothetical protein